MTVEEDDDVASCSISTSLLGTDQPHRPIVSLDQDLVLLLDVGIEVCLRKRRIT